MKTSRDNVKSLYTNIPNSEGVKALKISHDNFPRKTITTKLTATFLPLILTLSNFAFNCKNYIQIKDCVPWGLFVRRPMLIYLWIILKENAYLRYYKDFH